MANLVWILFVVLSELWLDRIHCLSYIEKGMLDRLLTYYDDKVRPADKRNFLADPNSPPIVINASLAIHRITFQNSLLTLDLELNEAWFDSRLQGSEKVRQRFQLPSGMHVWVPDGEPQTNSKSSKCQQRKLYMSDTARLESQCRFVVQVDCTGNVIDFPFDSHKCLVEIEAADSTDVGYLCDGCLESSDSRVAPPYFSVQSDVKTHSISKTDVYTSLLDPLTSGSSTTTTTVSPRLKRRRPVKNGMRKRGKGARPNKRTMPVYDEYEYEDGGEYDALGRMGLAIGRTIALELVLTRSAASYYIVTAMTPAIILVALAWIAVLNQRKTVKITLQSTALFALVVLWGNHRDQPSMTALDIWLLFCLCFICSTILESSLLACLPSLQRANSRSSVSTSSVNRVIYATNDKKSTGGFMGRIGQFGANVKQFFHQERVHLAFLVMYPLSFLIVSLIFWLPRIP